jgi:hypothetical protein
MSGRRSLKAAMNSSARKIMSTLRKTLNSKSYVSRKSSKRLLANLWLKSTTTCNWKMTRKMNNLYYLMNSNCYCWNCVKSGIKDIIGIDWILLHLLFNYFSHFYSYRQKSTIEFLKNIKQRKFFKIILFVSSFYV